jgi:hypothetical protein
MKWWTGHTETATPNTHMYWTIQPSAFHCGPSQKPGCWPSSLALASSYALSSAGDISGSGGVTVTLFLSAGTFRALARCSDPKRRPEEGRTEWWRLGENEEIGRGAGAAERGAAEVEGAEASKRAIPVAVAMAAIALLAMVVHFCNGNGRTKTDCLGEKSANPSTQRHGLDFIHPYSILAVSSLSTSAAIL